MRNVNGGKTALIQSVIFLAILTLPGVTNVALVTNAGTLYGRGVYFAEACTKSDEYAAVTGSNLTPMLVCRVTCGNVRYTDEIYPKVIINAHPKKQPQKRPKKP